MEVKQLKSEIVSLNEIIKQNKSQEEEWEIQEQEHQKELEKLQEIIQGKNRDLKMAAERENVL